MTVVRAPRASSESGGWTESTCGSLAALELVDVDVADADPPHLALVDELRHRRPTTPRTACPSSSRASAPGRGRCARRRAGAGSARTRGGSTRAQVVLDHAVRPPVPVAPALREHVDVLADAVGLERAADDLLRVAEPVDRRGVDPVDAPLDRVADRRDRLVVVDGPPAELPRAADRPRAEPDRRDLGPAARPSGLVLTPSPARRRRGSRATSASASSRGAAAPSPSRSPRRPRARAAGTRCPRRRSGRRTVSTRGWPPIVSGEAM